MLIDVLALPCKGNQPKIRLGRARSKQGRCGHPLAFKSKRGLACPLSSFHGFHPHQPILCAHKMPSLPSTRALFATTAAAALFLSSFPSWVLATGDYPCTSTADCKNWETSETPLSGNSTCVADPLQPEYGYCGYAGAPCGVDADCDYGEHPSRSSLHVLLACSLGP